MMVQDGQTGGDEIELTDAQLRTVGPKILTYHPLPAAERFHASPAKNRWILGGNRCVGCEQQIYDPVLKVSRRVDSIHDPFHVLAWDGTKLIVAEASRPFTKPPQWILDVELSNGEHLTCAATHRVMMADGRWCAVSDITEDILLFSLAYAADGASASQSLRVKSRVPKRFDIVYDLTVPVYHNYYASGVISRNSGKSEACIAWDLCSFALGVHPWRPTPPRAVIWAATDTWAMAGKVLWEEKIQQYIPPGRIKKVIWHNQGAGIPSEVRLTNGGKIEFRAYEQGRDAFQGRAIDAFYGDEQIPYDSENIWHEIQARLMDRNGFSAQSMTPNRFQPWLERRLKDLPATDEVFYADLEDNRKSRGGYVDDAEIDALIAQWPIEVQTTRVKGRFAAFLGAVFKTFSRDVHVCEPFKVPPDWPRWRSIDFGFANPFACLWICQDPERRWYVYREHYQAQESLAYHAERIKGLSGQERYRCTWADHDAQDRYELEKHGIRTMGAKKGIRLGIEAMQRALKIQADGRPRLYVFSTCPHTIQEVQGYRWAEGTESRDAKDEPLKVNDHTVDPLCYHLLGAEGGYYFSESDLT